MTYACRATRFALFHNERHPLEMGEQEISAFLTPNRGGLAVRSSLDWSAHGWFPPGLTAPPTYT